MNDIDSGQLIVIGQDNADAACRYLATITTDAYKGPSTLCSFPVETPADKARLFNLTGGASESITELQGGSVTAEHVIFQRGVFYDEEEQREALVCRLWFIAPDGQAYYTAARSIVDSMARAIAMFGPPPWNPPMHFAFHKGQSKKGRPWWHVEILPMSFAD